MKLLKSAFFISLITISLSGHAEPAELNCSSFTSNGRENGAIKLKVADRYALYNGVVRLTGEALLAFFNSEIKSIPNSKCAKDSTGNDVCEFKAQLDLKTKTIFVGGKYEPGFVGYPEKNEIKTDGIKLVSTFNGAKTGKDWFFSWCKQE